MRQTQVSSATFPQGRASTCTLLGAVPTEVVSEKQYTCFFQAGVKPGTPESAVRGGVNHQTKRPPSKKDLSLYVCNNKHGKIHFPTFNRLLEVLIVRQLNVCHKYSVTCDKTHYALMVWKAVLVSCAMSKHLKEG